jgi:hypothetical protein
MTRVLILLTLPQEVTAAYRDRLRVARDRPQHALLSGGGLCGMVNQIKRIVSNE